MELGSRKKYVEHLLLLLGAFIGLELIGLCGLVFLHLFVSGDVPIGALMPHPVSRPLKVRTSEFDPNLGWYHPLDMFGNPRQPLPLKRAGEVRVFLLGGSTVWGIGAGRESETIAKRLEFYLNSPEGRKSLGGSVTVYNAGVPGYYSKQELILLITKIIPFQQPDVVLVLDGVNDFLVYSNNRPHLDRAFSNVWHWGEVEFIESLERIGSPGGAIVNAFVWSAVWITRKTFVGNLFDQGVRLATRSKQFGLGEHLVSGRVRMFNPMDSAHAVSSESRDYYLGNVAMMKSLCEGAAVEFYWFPQPTLFLKSRKTAEELKNYNRPSERFWIEFREFYDNAFKKGAYARFGKATFFQDISDALEAFEGNAYVDFWHYSPAAQDAIAQRMARVILSSKKRAL